jgi:uncharacterized phosphosugar-binding protein
MISEEFVSIAKHALDSIMETQKGNIARAAAVLVNSVVSSKAIFSFGASHSFIITEELVYRTGGLMLVNPIYPHGMNFSVHPLPATSKMERVPGLGAELLAASPAKEGDVLLITSTSGRNAVVIDMALEAAKKNIRTIGITSMAYSDGVSSRHHSGKKLSEICEIVIDNCSPYGDAALEIEGFPQKVGPLSTITGCTIAHCLVAETVQELHRRGITPPVFMSANLDGGDEFNRRLMDENKYRIFYA